jgi:rare lipoprotein A (peptidoglycan hydrolase)
VTSGGRSVVVTLVDVCRCRGERIIDLYADAFRRLAPLSRGVIEVTVR